MKEPTRFHHHGQKSAVDAKSMPRLLSALSEENFRLRKCWKLGKFPYAVTAYGDGHKNCRIKNWSSAGADFVVNVRCANTAHIPENAQFTILVNWH